MKREENFVKEKAPDNVVRRRKNNKDDNKADIDDVRDDIDDSDIDNQSNEDESVLGDSAHRYVAVLVKFCYEKIIFEMKKLYLK